MASLPTSQVSTSPGISELAQSFKRTLLAENKAAKTVKTYMESLSGLERFLQDNGMPLGAANITREHVESYLADLLTRWKPATASNRYRSLQSFWKWCVEEGEVKSSPMAHMRPPKVPEDPPRCPPRTN